MTPFSRRAKVHILIFFLFSVYITGCVRPQPIPSQSMNFKQGMKVLAADLAEQLEKSKIRNVLNKIVINPLTKQKQLQKIVIDPFIDVESGYPVKVNTKIKEIISAEIQKRFDITGIMDPDTLMEAEYVLNGMVSLRNKKEDVYKVNAAVFEKSTGKVLASSSVQIIGFDTTPMDIYKDSPIYLKGNSYSEHQTSVKKNPGESIDQNYQNRLMIKAMLVKGDIMYEQREFRKSLSYYNHAAGSQSAESMDVLNGQYTNLAKENQWGKAEEVYGKLAKICVGETNGITSKITFDPDSTKPMQSKIEQYNIYIKQIAGLIASSPGCTVTIIGHSSKTGSAAYNDKLSLQRALSIKQEMASYFPEVMNRSKTIGRGFRENIVGTGRDDITDEIDRRVEFKFKNCSPSR